MRKSTSILSVGAALLMGSLLHVAPVQATTVFLDAWNDPNLNASTDRVQVDYNVVNGNTELTFTWVDGNYADGALGIDQIGWNSTAAIITCDSDFTCGGSNTMDGFGTFAVRATDPGGTTLSATFVLQGTAVFTQNDLNNTFAAHVRYENNCSGFVTDGGPGATSGESNCGGNVPEPTSLMLLGAGLAGIGIWRRKSA